MKAELDREKGILIYEVDIEQGVKYEVKLDANSGSVLEITLD